MRVQLYNKIQSKCVRFRIESLFKSFFQLMIYCTGTAYCVYSYCTTVSHLVVCTVTVTTCVHVVHVILSASTAKFRAEADSSHNHTQAVGTFLIAVSIAERLLVAGHTFSDFSLYCTLV